MDKPTPRVNQSLLSKYQGQAVRLVGKVKSKETGQVVVEASDGGQVTVHLIQDLQITSAFVEFIAHVNPDLTVRELTSIGLGDNFDLGNYNELVLLAQKLPEVFA